MKNPRIDLLILLTLLLRLDAWAEELGPEGAQSGQYFSDQCADVARVIIRSGSRIHSLQLVCRDTGRDQALPRRGGLGGAEQVFALGEYERITGVSGGIFNDGEDFVSAIQIHTSRHASPVYGQGGSQKGRKSFQLIIPPGKQFRGFSGRSDQFLNAIGILTAPTRDWATQEPAEIQTEPAYRIETIDIKERPIPGPTGPAYRQTPGRP